MRPPCLDVSLKFPAHLPIYKDMRHSSRLTCAPYSGSRNFLARTSNQRGFVLPTALILLVVLAFAAGAAINATMTDIKISGNYHNKVRVFYIAEAGLNRGAHVLMDGDGNNDYPSISATTTLFDAESFDGGSYTVLAEPAGPRVIVRATGCFPAGSPCPASHSKVLLEAELEFKTGRPEKAVQTGHDVKISGSPLFLGKYGAINANEDMEVSGNPVIQALGGLSAAGQTINDGGVSDGLEITGSPCIGSAACANDPPPSAYVLDSDVLRSEYENIHGSAPASALPTINPAAYAPLVARLGAGGNGYILHDNGTVTAGGTCEPDGLCSGGTAVPVPTGWQHVGDTWKVLGDASTTGVFYSEGKIEVVASPGTTSAPWEATLIARDHITISGDPFLKSYPTTLPALENTVLLTGHDLEITGAPQIKDGGAILVHQQFRITGDPVIEGFIIAGDGSPTWPEDPFSDASDHIAVSDITGNPTIVYDGSGGCSGPSCPVGFIEKVAWREVY